MEILYAVFVAPFLDIADSPTFFVEVVVTGLLTGVMYSLVALGFVLRGGGELSVDARIGREF